MAGRLVQLSGGRALGVSGFGDALAQRAVVMCHPAPGGGGFDPDPTVSTHWGARIVGIDRPGYGASDAWRAGERPSFATHADDIAQYLSRIESSTSRISAMELGPFGVVGWGLGGYAALALASRHPHLVDRVALVDVPDPGRVARERAPQPPFRVADVGIAPAEPAFESTAAGRRIRRMLDAAATQGAAGMQGDYAAAADDDWQRRLRDIRADVLLVYGDQHPTVDAHLDGRRLRRRLPRARVVRVEAGTGLSITTHWPSILNHVAPRHGGVSPTLRDGAP
ncbi:alpha/beta fold hydrolase [Microbacterium luteum]|uniref:alpha/beta fold hydrolase n=1 Tax=Microbacterium TaxID=33882 RepID=UPI0018876722|nr:alpha/beta fold hydrolase [Microbacterium luteum]